MKKLKKNMNMNMKKLKKKKSKQLEYSIFFCNLTNCNVAIDFFNLYLKIQR